MYFRLAVIAVAALAAIVPIPATFIERYYSTSVFPVLQRGMTAVSNLGSVAFLDVWLALAVLWFLWRTWRAVSAARRVGWTRPVTFWLIRMVAAGAGVYLAFLLLWGLNYRRVPITGKARFDQSRVTAEAARALALSAVDHANALYPNAHSTDAGGPLIDPTLAAGFEDAQRALGIQRPARPGRPKLSILDVYFTRAGVEGMTDPFFLETLVAGDLLPFERPQVIAHEWSHLAGFANEGEASFVGWLTCMRASDPAQYSGWLFLYGEVAGELKPTERAEVAGRLADGPRADLRAIADRVRRHVRPVVANAGWRVYDRYLKANRVDAGVRSYGEVVRLVLGVRFE
jgi:hypothetical protein